MMMKTDRKTRFPRRGFMGSAAAMAAAVIVPRSVLGGPGRTPPSDKFNIAGIGAGGRGYFVLQDAAAANVIALCDVDTKRADKTFRRYPAAKRFRDYRVLMERMKKQLDAVVIAAPDHHHIPASIMAMRMGLHVYCEKPLGQNIFEIRKAAKIARETGMVTQMGNGAHSGPNYRSVVRMVKDGIIGEVREAHSWCDEAWEPGDRPKHRPPVPDHLDWNLWIGPAPMRPYHPTYHPQGWRSWWDFGNGRIGDMGCHMLDLPFSALDLKFPQTVEAESHRPARKESTTKWLIARWTFAARGNLPPVKLTWYDGGKRPPLQKKHSMPDWPEASLFVGSKGMLIADYGRFKLFPEEKFKHFRRPRIPRKPSHMNDWIEACKANDPSRPGSNFSYSGPLTETVLLAIVAYRAGEKLSWDARNMKITNCPRANRFTHRASYRKGWTI